MSPEEKLSYLKHWMDFWIDCRISQIDNVKKILSIYKSTEILLNHYPSETISIPFDEYIQMIEETK